MRVQRYFAFGLTAALTACGGSTNRFYPATPMSSAPQSHLEQDVANVGDSRAHDTPLSGEAFSAHNVTVTTTACNGGKAWVQAADFSASGRARGPYPGTFHVTGAWGWESIYGNAQWIFSESFTITSGTSKVSGTGAAHGNGFGPVLTCKTFGPAGKAVGIKYHFRTDGIHYSGPVTVRDIASGSFHEKLL
jgi:hypothetical protein